MCHHQKMLSQKIFCIFHPRPQKVECWIYYTFGSFLVTHSAPLINPIPHVQRQSQGASIKLLNRGLFLILMPLFTSQMYTYKSRHCIPESFPNSITSFHLDVISFKRETFSVARFVFIGQCPQNRYFFVKLGTLRRSFL